MSAVCVLCRNGRLRERLCSVCQHPPPPTLSSHHNLCRAWILGHLESNSSRRGATISI